MTMIPSVKAISGQLFKPFVLSVTSSSQQVRWRNPPKNPKRYMTWPNDWLPFQWEFPEREIGYFATGDPEEKFRETHKDMIEGEFRRGFEFLKNREDVPETVKTLFRLKHQKRREIVSFIRRKRNEGFQRNPLDEKSHEVQIANFTSKIRQQQEKIRYDNPNLVIFKSLISYYTNKRNRLLNELSRMDRERYRIVVEKLKISHKPSEPGVLDRPPIFRKDILTKLTKEYCDNIRQQRMTAYHDKLKSQQQDFLKERKETLEWIDNEMKKYHITEDDVRTEVRLRDKYRDPPNRRDPVSTI